MRVIGARSGRRRDGPVLLTALAKIALIARSDLVDVSGPSASPPVLNRDSRELLEISAGDGVQLALTQGRLADLKIKLSDTKQQLGEALAQVEILKEISCSGRRSGDQALDDQLIWLICILVLLLVLLCFFFAVHVRINTSRNREQPQPNSDEAPGQPSWLESYTDRMFKGKKRVTVFVAPDWSVVGWSVLNTLFGICVLGAFDKLLSSQSDYRMIVAAFGAQAVLIFGAPGLPLAQPWNCIAGNMVSSLVGVAVRELFSMWDFLDVRWLVGGVAVSLSIGAMYVTSSLHPPGGAIALIAILGGSEISDLGFGYVLCPAGLGSLVMVSVGMLLNNLSSDPKRHYPSSWPIPKFMVKKSKPSPETNTRSGPAELNVTTL